MLFSAMFLVAFHLTTLPAQIVPASTLEQPCLTGACPLPAPNGEIVPPVLALRIIAPDNAHGSKTIQLRCIVANKTPAPALNVVLKFLPPKGTKFLRSFPIATEKDGEYLWTASSVKGLAEEQVVVELGIDTNTDFRSCFKVNFEHGICATTKPSCAPADTNKGSKDSEPRPLTGTASMKITKSITDDFDRSWNISRPVPFEITVTNNGTLPLKDVLIQDQLGRNVEYINGSATDAQDFRVLPEGNNLQWRIDTIPPGDVRRVQFKARVKVPGRYSNSALATGLAPNGQTVRTDPATINFDASGMANLYMEVIDSVDPIFVANEKDNTQSRTVYQIRIRNTGNAPANNVSLRNFIPKGLFIEKEDGGIDDPKVMLPQRLQGVNQPYTELVWPPFSLPAGGSKLFQIWVLAERENLYRFKAVLNSDALNNVPLQEEETTHVVNAIPPDSR